MGRATLLALLLGFASLPGTARAQGVIGTILARANVLNPITVTGQRSIQFGNVLPGVPKTISPGPTASGRFLVLGRMDTGVMMSFTLPTELTGPGVLPIGNWTGIWYTDNLPAHPSAVSFTPSGAPTLAAFGSVGRIFTWVGATVFPTASQATGLYSGTVLLTVNYY